MCQHPSVALPEYVKVEDSMFGARYKAKLPKTEMYLSRVGEIGLTGLVVGSE